MQTDVRLSSLAHNAIDSMNASWVRSIARIWQIFSSIIALVTLSMAFRRIRNHVYSDRASGCSEAIALIVVLLFTLLYSIWTLFMDFYHCLVKCSPRTTAFIDVVFAGLLLTIGIIFVMSDYSAECFHYNDSFECDSLVVSTTFTFLTSVACLISSVGSLHVGNAHDNTKSDIHNEKACNAVCLPYEEYITPVVGPKKMKAIVTPTTSSYQDVNGDVNTYV